MDKKIYDITIIGGGPVGLFTAFYAGLRGMTVKVIESLSELGGQPAILYPEKMIYDIPAIPEISGADLTANLIKQLERFEESTTICLKEEVTSFSRKDGIFILETTKRQHLSRSIIIACGNGAFSPRPLGIEGEAIYSDNNLYYNVRQLDQFAGQEVLICGGGDSAVDWALALEKIAKKVTIAHRREAFRAHEHSVDALKASTVDILTPFIPYELKGEGDKATSLVLQKVKSEEQIEVPFDSIIVSFGFATSNKNLKNWDLESKRTNILVSSTFETTMPGVYAVGDAADYLGKVDLIATGFGEAPIAVNQAIAHIYPEKDNRPVHSTSLIK
ncbi:NAD(P)/FAD-dependent oxidoreductase [Streptococcus fryi]